MLNNLPLGIEDFRELRQTELLYVDKTQLTMDLIDRPTGSLGLPLPDNPGPHR